MIIQLAKYLKTWHCIKVLLMITIEYNLPKSHHETIEFRQTIFDNYLRFFLIVSLKITCKQTQSVH